MLCGSGGVTDVGVRSCLFFFFFFFSSRRRHTRLQGDWSSDGALPILYTAQCASCHGGTGGGDGGLAASLSGRPPALRDLAVQGRLSHGELEQVILRGRPGTPMPRLARALDPAPAAPGVAFLRGPCTP